MLVHALCTGPHPARHQGCDRDVPGRALAAAAQAGADRPDPPGQPRPCPRPRRDPGRRPGTPRRRVPLRRARRALRDPSGRQGPQAARRTLPRAHTGEGKAHGRLEKRTIQLAEASETIRARHPHARTVARVRRRVVRTTTRGKGRQRINTLLLTILCLENPA